MAFAVADPYAQAIRSGGLQLWYSVDATRGGVPITGATDLRPSGGTITDTTKPGVRRVLNLKLPPSPGLFDALSPVGVRLKVSAHVRYTGQRTVAIPMGVFDVDQESSQEGGGELSFTAPDKWVLIQRARFVQPKSSNPGVPVTTQIATLIRGALGSSEEVVVTATSTAPVGTMTWEKDRDKAIMDLAESIGAWVYFDRNGVATIADVPTIGSSADWLIDASPSGTLLDLNRQRNRTDTANVVVVSSSSASPSFATQFVWDSDPNSPTYAGPAPVTNPELAGAFGVVPYFYDTPLPLDSNGATAAGRTILARVSGLASQVSLGGVPNPAMDAFDVIDVLPLRERYDIPRVLERHVADNVTHSLGLGALSVDGRSTRAEKLA